MSTSVAPPHLKLDGICQQFWPWKGWFAKIALSGQFVDCGGGSLTWNDGTIIASKDTSKCCFFLIITKLSYKLLVG